MRSFHYFAFFAAVGAPCLTAWGCAETPVPAAAKGKVYDLTQTSEFSTAQYLPEVHEFKVEQFTVTPPNGSSLVLNGVFTAKLHVAVSAEPVRADVEFGLATPDGQHCELGTLELHHLETYFEAADRANAAPALDEPAAPSLAACKQGESCKAAGEACIGFLEAQPPTAAEIAANKVVAPKEIWRCMTDDYAVGTVASRKAGKHLVNPADLAGGSTAGVYLLELTTSVPQTCAKLVGKSDLTLWVAFDAEGRTAFDQRPAAAVLKDALTGQTSVSDDSFVHRLAAYDVPLGESLAEQKDWSLDFIELTTPGSLLLYNDLLHKTTDLTLAAKLAVSGKELTAPAPVGKDALSFTAKMHAGQALPDCVASIGVPGPPDEPVEFLTGEKNGDGTPKTVSELTSTVGDAQAVFARDLELHWPDAVHDRMVTGDWKCTRTFAVEVCATSALAFTAESPKCHSVEFELLHAHNDAVIPKPAGGGGGQPKNMQACDENLLKDYQKWVKLQSEAESEAKFEKFYVIDWMAYWENSFKYHPPTSMAYWKFVFTDTTTRTEVWKDIRECVEGTVALNSKSDLKLGAECDGNKTWLGKKGGSSLAAYAYVMEYVWESYKKYRNDAVGWSRGSYRTECEGIADGRVCGKINNDPNRVNEIKDKVLALVAANAYGDQYAKDISLAGEGHRCIGMMRSLQRVSYDMSNPGSGIYSPISDDGAFFNEMLPRRCIAKGYEDERKKVWAQIEAKCATKPTENVNNASGYSGERILVKKWLLDVSLPEKGGIQPKFRAGLLTDVRTKSVGGGNKNRDMKFTFGPELNLWLDTSASGIGEIIEKITLYKWHMQAEFYAGKGGEADKATWMDAGQEVLMRHIYRIRFPMPPVPSVDWPEPPGFSKEKEKCKYIRPLPCPVGLELCVAMTAKAEIGISAKVIKNGLKGSNENENDDGYKTWPGGEGTVEPSMGVVATARVGIDFVFGSAGVKVEVDVIKYGLPVSVGCIWTIKSTDKGIEYKIKPYIKASRVISTLSGAISLYVRLKFPKKEWSQKLYDWEGKKDELDLFSFSDLEKGTVGF